MIKLLISVKIYFDLFIQFGLKYFIFRTFYELEKKTLSFRFKFPVKYGKRIYPGYNYWLKTYSNRFIIPSREMMLKNTLFSKCSKLKSEVDKIISGKICFFSNKWIDIGFDNESFIHPISKHRYQKKHWSKLSIYNNQIGDIKYIWEKSKFSFLLTLIRSDVKNNTDNSNFALNEIQRWITENPPNMGPQYICSQEISIRLINWSYALFFYQNSKTLNNKLLKDIFSSIEIQLDHIYKNINLSKIAIRNNHAVTETLALYLISLYFPFLKNAKKYKLLGKKWFEDEIEFQIFDDGSDSQYSFNYHRVKVQLLSLAISSAHVNKETFKNCVYERSEKSIEFLIHTMGNYEDGFLPNFGPNDGSLYFKLNNVDFRNYIPQINALAFLLNLKLPFKIKEEFKEDSFWYNFKLKSSTLKTKKIKTGFSSFNNGGYLLIKELNNTTLLKTPFIKFRAAQNDLLHLDIWHKGYNILIDTGSYSYNTDELTSMSFNGVSGHNTASLNGKNHMLKGPRFTWIYKPKLLSSETFEDEDKYKIVSSMLISYPKKYIINRTIIKYKNSDIWEVEDFVSEGMCANDKLFQFWNLAIDTPFKVELIELDNVKRTENIGYESLYYGEKNPINKIILSTNSNILKVKIKIL